MKQATTLLFACLLFLTSFASDGIKFEQNMTWAQVKARAAKEKKMIFFDAYTTWCGPCKYLEQSVYTDAAVAAYYNANFINVKFDMEDGEGIQLAELFEIDSYPTLLFFSPDGKPAHKFIGAMKASEFIELGKDAKIPAKQYYSLMDKVIAQNATNEDFLKWTEMADELEDKNRRSLASNWLAAQKDILGSVELARATFFQANVSESQLTYLYSQKQKIQKLLGWNEEKTEDMLYRKLFQMAIKKIDFEKPDTRSFTALINQFHPSKLNYALQELSLQLALNYEKDAQKGIQVLLNSIKGDQRISLPEFSNLLIDYVSGFDKAGMEKIIKELANYSFAPVDNGNEWGLYLAMVICNSRVEQPASATKFAKKAFEHAGLPQYFKNVLKESYGL